MSCAVVSPTAIHLDAYGVAVELRAYDAELLAALRRVAPPGASATKPTAHPTVFSIVEDDGSYLLLVDGCRTAKSAHLDEILGLLESALHFHVAVAARTRLFVHAGVVAWKGGAIVLPGRTRAGKSSLVAALVRAGATYYSDEYAVLDDAAFVHPFARALGIRDDTGRTRRVDPRTIGDIGEAPLPVTRVIATRYVSGGAWHATTMSPGETALALLDNTLAARSRPADALRVLAQVARHATGVRGERGDATAAVEQILT
ncbi:MAG TPA: hypothetical protein VJW73_15100 [Gemmatimonadaceae bacterium]|nr:hypothetical protein [Gemmatimonadaceae bacterium]